MSWRFLALALLLPSLAYAASQPCLDGSCTFHINNGTGGATTGSVFLNGSTSAISDLTEEAGWTVIACDAQNNSHAVRAICTGSNSTCSHLYNNGANNTIVRLPEGCGKGPFARIANEWEHENQTIPDHVRNVLTKRDGESDPTVRGILLDTNWTAVDPGHHGPVSLHILATTGHDANATVNAAIAARDNQERSLFDKLKQIASNVTSGADTTTHKLENITEESAHKVPRADLDERGFGGFPSIGSPPSIVGGSVSATAKAAANDTTTPPVIATENGASAPQSASESSIPGPVIGPTGFSDNKSDSTPFSGFINKQVASGSIPCTGAQNQPSFTANYDISARAQASGTLSYGLVIAGTMIPVDVTQFSMSVGLDADISSTISWNALGGISTSTGLLTLSQTDLPGLSIADVFEIDPVFQLNFEATQQVQSNAQLTVDIAYTISGAQLSVPSGPSSGTFTPQDASVDFYAASGTANSGDVTAHVIPTIAFNLNAFSGLQQTSLNVNMDASASLDLSLQKADVNSFSGNVEINSGLAVNAAATSSFFDLLHDSQYPGASHSWKLWSASYNGPARRDHARELPLKKRAALAAGLSCVAAPASTTLEALCVSTISASDITQTS